MGFYRTAEAHDRALRERWRREYLRIVAAHRKLRQEMEDAWYEKFKQAQAQRKVEE